MGHTDVKHIHLMADDVFRCILLNTASRSILQKRMRAQEKVRSHNANHVIDAEKHKPVNQRLEPFDLHLSIA